MWTCENRPKYNRDKLRYPSDLTDEEWSHVAPLIRPAKHAGRKRKVDVREVINGIMYVLSTGCQWRYVPFHPRARSSILSLCGITPARWRPLSRLDHHSSATRRPGRIVTPCVHREFLCKRGRSA